MPIRSMLVVGSRPGTGPHSFCNNLRRALSPYGVRVLGFVPERITGARAALSEPGDDVLLRYDGEREAVEALIDFIQTRRIDAVIPSNGPLLTSAVPHFPQEVLVLARCNAIVNSAYHFVTRHRVHMPLIATISPRQRYDLVVKWGVSTRRIRFTPHGTEVPTSLADIYSEPGKVVFVGRIERAKGAHLLPVIMETALTKGSEFRLEVLGEGSYRQALEQELMRRKLEDRVTFRGNVPRLQVMEALSHAHVLVNPTQHDGFGLVTVEAMAHGAVPIVSRIRGVTTAIVEDGRSGVLCPPRSAVSFGNAIAATMANRDRLQKMRQRAHERACSQFSLDAMALRYLSALRELKEDPQFRRAPALPLSRYQPHHKYSPTFFEKLVHKVF